MNSTIELAARLVGQNFVRLQHGETADAWQYTMSAHDVALAFSQYRDAEIERLRAALEVSQAATNAAVSKAQFQASTNAELNALHDQVRRLKAAACARVNDELGA